MSSPLAAQPFQREVDQVHPVGMLGYRLPPLATVSRAPHTHAETVVLVHGFGCNRATMATAFASAALAPYHLIAVELPGHGTTPPLDNDEGMSLLGWMGALVRYTATSLYRPGPERRMHVVAHSAGLPVLHASGLTHHPNMGRVIGVEGNLLPEDCTFTTLVAEQSREQFEAEGHQQLTDRIYDMGGAAAHRWAADLASTDSGTLHRFASEVVAACAGPALRTWWQQLPERTWLYGQQSGITDDVLQLNASALVVPVPGSGHFPMVDNPGDLWGAVGQHLQLAPQA